MIDELGIVEAIDRHLQIDGKERDVSLGILCKALILNGLGFTQRTLYMVSTFFEDKPIEVLLGEGVEPGQLNDTSLGRCLDAIHRKVWCERAKFEAQAERKGRFIVATNEPDEEKLSDLEMLKNYQGQAKVERGFRFLKDPQFMAATLFVKKPERVEALLFIMTLCLSVYAGLEYRVREKLAAAQETLPNQLGKEVKNPTMRWIFACFNGIHILDTADKKLVLNIKPLHLKVLHLLGQKYLNYYFLN